MKNLLNLTVVLLNKKKKTIIRQHTAMYVGIKNDITCIVCNQ